MILVILACPCLNEAPELATGRFVSVAEAKIKCSPKSVYLSSLHDGTWTKDVMGKKASPAGLEPAAFGWPFEGGRSPTRYHCATRAWRKSLIFPKFSFDISIYFSFSRSSGMIAKIVIIKRIALQSNDARIIYRLYRGHVTKIWGCGVHGVWLIRVRSLSETVYHL